MSTEPSRSGYRDWFIPSLFPDDASMQDKAGKVLQDILHDYSAFAVSTIDRFFQQALKAFSREIGHFASYQVELDKDSLVAESVDRILDSLTEENSGLLSWLTDNVLEQIEQGGRYSMDANLLEMAKRLKSPQRQAAIEQTGVDPETFTGRMELKMRANALSRKDLASLAPEIFSGAEQGDPILCALIRESAHFIGEMACAVTDPEQKEKRILACGGLFQAGESFRKMCAESFRQKCPDGELIFAHGSTLCGFAAVRALTLCGITDSSIHNKQLEDF